ncbi:MAG: VOC family protein [Microbacteriaceae bacterium]
MPTVTDFPQGTPIWVDLQSTDSAAAAEFYAALLGWDMSEPTEQTGAYRRAFRDGVPVCAIGALPAALAEKGAVPVWTTYLAVDDADAATAAVGEAGGTVLLPPGDRGNGVRLSIVVDPSSAVVGLWQGTGYPGSWLRDEEGAVSWFELLAEHAEESLPFYESVFGASVTNLAAGESEYPMLGVGEATFAGVGASDVPGLPAHWRVYFEVPDLASSVKQVLDGGGRVLADIVSADGVGSWAAVADPQGAVFSLIQSQPAEVDEGEADAGPEEE